MSGNGTESVTSGKKYELVKFEKIALISSETLITVILERLIVRKSKKHNNANNFTSR